MTWNTPGGQYYTLYRDMLDQSHLLVAGSTGSGKSVVINALIHTALLRAPVDANGGVKFILCDPKMVELSRYERLPHVLRYADSLSAIAGALQYGHSIMLDRYADMKRHGLVEWDRGDLYIIVDEFADLILHNSNREENKIRTSIESTIQSIAQMGRAAHVHLILATQAPNRKTIKANIATNMTGTVALWCKKPIESKQLIGSDACTTLPVPKLEHRAEAYYDNGVTLDRWNIPMIPPEEIAARVKFWTDQKPTKPTSRNSILGFWGKVANQFGIERGY